MTQINLPYLAAARVSGADAGSFLQAQLSADLSRLTEGEACFAAYCDPTGNVLAVLRVIRIGDGYALVAARDLMGSLLGRLAKYVLRARVVLEPVDSTIAGSTVNGALHYALVPLGEAPVECDSAAVEGWRAAELGSGVTWLGPATSGRFLPQVLGMDRLGAVSFRKGCFPGQEVIARVRYRGKLKQLPLIAKVEGRADVAPGAELNLLVGDEAAGSAVVVDSCPAGGATVVFLVARKVKAGTVSAVEIGGRRLAIEEMPQAWATI